MRSRLESIPIYESRLTSIDASYYNLVRLALLRINKMLRLRLKSLHSLDFLLDSETWIVVDRTMNDKPMLAWLDFETKNRDSLFKPVPCRINYYHSQSTIIVDKVLEVLHFTLNEKLAQRDRFVRPRNVVIPMKKSISGNAQ